MLYCAFPPAVYFPAALEYLDLSANYLTGTLPASIGNLTNLRLLNLGKNGFTDLGLCEWQLQWRKLGLGTNQHSSQTIASESQQLLFKVLNT